MPADERRPLIPSRGLVLFPDFCRHTGIDEGTAAELLRVGKIEGLYRPDGTPLGFMDDALPSREEMLAWGLSVADGYNPEALQSHEEDGDDEPGPGELGTRMTWGAD